MEAIVADPKEAVTFGDVSTVAKAPERATTKDPAPEIALARAPLAILLPEASLLSGLTMVVDNASRGEREH